MKVKESEIAQSCPTVCNPWTVAHQASPSMGFSRQEYWSGLPEETEIKLPTSNGSSKKQEGSIKTFFFCLIDYAKAFDYVDHNKLWKILKEMGMNTRPPDLPSETSVFRSGNNSWNWTWNNRLVVNRKRSTSRLYIVTLLI